MPVVNTLQAYIAVCLQIHCNPSSYVMLITGRLYFPRGVLYLLLVCH